MQTDHSEAASEQGDRKQGGRSDPKAGDEEGTGWLNLMGSKKKERRTTKSRTPRSDEGVSDAKEDKSDEKWWTTTTHNNDTLSEDEDSIGDRSIAARARSRPGRARKQLDELPSLDEVKLIRQDTDLQDEAQEGSKSARDSTKTKKKAHRKALGKQQTAPLAQSQAPSQPTTKPKKSKKEDLSTLSDRKERDLLAFQNTTTNGNDGTISTEVPTPTPRSSEFSKQSVEGSVTDRSSATSVATQQEPAKAQSHAAQSGWLATHRLAAAESRGLVLRRLFPALA
ncbi:hypothetical protein CYMTET_13705 [Cymbomonas tetramitiformis]|uniref:Uncharacterized protein n=1 Tax=Cymbomonas tetramitiformis TaxID=36881 RepID=A0AAE0GHV7_9CHLO|nr:hypothetical protein CYMTET_13705 [Cymbomonas tetramitiformis]